MNKEQKIIAFIKHWLDCNMDEPIQDTTEEDSANLKQFIEYFETETLDVNSYIE